MHANLFTYDAHFDGRDDAGDWHIQFYNVTLKVDIGPHKAGTQFSCVSMDFEKSLLHLYSEDGETKETYQLLVSVGDKL